MNRIKYIILISIPFLFFTSCEKDKDVVKKETIKGNVFNTCTGKGFANVDIKFLERHEKRFNKVDVISHSCTTDASGNFIFQDIDIHNGDEYSYALNIESHYYYDYNFYGIGPIEYSKSELLNFHRLGISASFKICTFYLPSGTVITPPDTFVLRLEQRTLHYYEPNRIWEGTVTPISFSTGNPNFGNYPMGCWNITLNKTKGGVHSIIEDSIYLGMGDTSHYNIPW
jgi:hypothetical protein